MFYYVFIIVFFFNFSVLLGVQLLQLQIYLGDIGSIQESAYSIIVNYSIDSKKDLIILIEHVPTTTYP